MLVRLMCIAGFCRAPSNSLDLFVLLLLYHWTEFEVDLKLKFIVKTETNWRRTRERVIWNGADFGNMQWILKMLWRFFVLGVFTCVAWLLWMSIELNSVWIFFIWYECVKNTRGSEHNNQYALSVTLFRIPNSFLACKNFFRNFRNLGNFRS